MTLTKAIELNRDLAAGIDHEDLQDCKAAILLGIEALKREKEHRFFNPSSSAILLPGETEK